MVSYERILWSHTRGYYGLIREDTMVSYERILWSHIRRPLKNKEMEGRGVLGKKGASERGGSKE